MAEKKKKKFLSVGWLGRGAETATGSSELRWLEHLDRTPKGACHRSGFMHVQLERGSSGLPAKHLRDYISCLSWEPFVSLEASGPVAHFQKERHR